MSELDTTQFCPYCEYEVEDHQSEWEEGNHEIECMECGETYAVETVYQFEGWKCQKICKECDALEEECCCD